MRRLCLEPGCPDPPTARGRCRVHARGLVRASRDRRPHRHVYSTKRWAMTRRRKLNRDPMCQDCNEVLATEVHHVRDLEDGGAPYSMANLRSLCKSCHAAETRERMNHHE